MKTYLAIYLGSPDSPNAQKWEKLSEKEQASLEQKGIAQWMAWMEKNKSSIIDGGAPLGSTKAVDNKGLRDTRNQMTAYTLVRAESHDAAAKLFLDHPHFKVFPGDSIEIMECLPIPT